MFLDFIIELKPLIFLAGVLGAIVADLFQDNCLVLPKKVGDIVNLGSIGGCVIGGFVGLLIDGQLQTAFLGGFFGKEIIGQLIDSRFNKVKIEEK